MQNVNTEKVPVVLEENKYFTTPNDAKDMAV